MTSSRTCDRPSLALRLIACLAAVPLLTACSPEDDPTPTQPPVVDGTDTSTTAPMADEGCPDAYPDRLALTTDVPEEVEYLDQIAACSASAQGLRTSTTRAMSCSP